MTITYRCNMIMHLELSIIKTLPLPLPFLQNVFQQNSRMAEMRRSIITGMQMIKAKTEENRRR